MFEHPILVYTRFMGEGVRADNGLVRLDNNARVIADEFTDAGDLFGIDTRFQTKDGTSRVQSHDNFLKRRISCPLADAVDRDFGLPCAGTDTCQCVGGGHAKVVVAVDRNNNVLIHPRSILDDPVN